MKIKKFSKLILECSLALVMVAGASFSAFAAESLSTNSNKKTALVTKNLTSINQNKKVQISDKILSNNSVLSNIKLQSDYAHNDAYIRSIKIYPVDTTTGQYDETLYAGTSFSNNDSFCGYTLTKTKEMLLKTVFRSEVGVVPDAWLIEVSFEVSSLNPLSIQLNHDGQEQSPFAVEDGTIYTEGYVTPNFTTSTTMTGVLTFRYPDGSPSAGTTGTSQFLARVSKEQ